MPIIFLKIMSHFIVLKFGGTSVGSAKRIQALPAIIKPVCKSYRVIVVCSAMSGVTDLLIHASELAAASDFTYSRVYDGIVDKHVNVIQQLFNSKDAQKLIVQISKDLDSLHKLILGVSYTGELSARTRDYILSFGERLSCQIIAAYFTSQKIKSQYVDMRSLVKTDEHFGEALVDFDATDKNIQTYFKDVNEVCVATGFISSTDKDITTTLGRGGSDYTAAIIGAALKSHEIQIWTDVSGVMTADPSKVKQAMPIAQMSYIEAMEMCYFGAKVIHPPTIQPALNKNIPLRIKNSMQPDDEGTYITHVSAANDHLIKGISSIDNINIVTIQGSGMVGVAGVAARVFTALAQHKINVILITQGSSEHNITFAVRQQDSAKAKKVVEKTFSLELQLGLIEPVSVHQHLAILAIIGENMKNTPGVSGRLFQSLGKNGISVIATAQGSSELNISVVIKQEQLSKALNTLHQAFFLSNHKSIHVFIVGVGLIGNKLMEQMNRNRQYLLDTHNIQLKISGIADSKLMLHSENNIKVQNAKQMLQDSGEAMNMSKYVKRMLELNLANSVFVDCTANDTVAKHYEKILTSAISIVTPNKVANSGSYADYKLLKDTADKHHVKYLYETNVGAGLPVINTLKDLIISGDRIIRIDAVLSGTLSFIFNTFNSNLKFSDVVMQAKEKGFTEPDPRDDLSCKDFARKLLILARESGTQIELDEIVIHDWLPAECMKPKDVAGFFEVLKKYDDHFSKLALKAEKENNVLRMIGSYIHGKAEMKLTAVDATNPFYNLSGSDNLIAFTTQRYHSQPLVIKGPGAGAEVTAAGVLAEVISISNYLL